ncbi:hypothetical protein KEM48_001761 [Puccinia striiformis f. sp. tritici PST-130]|nr:hypothetical protein KEM48_001761 [Puccinia striiformis f. sp. tritici PST-130]
MLQFFRFIALLVLIAAWEVASIERYFGCPKNVDAICSGETALDPDAQTLRWAERLHPKKRDYLCRDSWPLCCNQNQFDINNAPNNQLIVEMIKTETVGIILALVRAATSSSTLVQCFSWNTALFYLLISKTPSSCLSIIFHVKRSV